MAYVTQSSVINIDEVALFSTVLTPSEVATLASESTSPAVTGTAVAVQGAQTAEGDATKAGTLVADGTTVAVQDSQTAIVTSTRVHPDEWGWAVQGQQSAIATVDSVTVVNKHYFATKGQTLNTLSTPAGLEIPPTLKIPGNFKREIDLKNFGIVKPTFGEVVISNLDGQHDDLLTKGFDGQKALIYYGPVGGTFPDEYRKILDSTAAGISYDYDKIRVKLRDNLEYLDQPYLQKVFIGTGGTQGDANVVDQKRQKHFGRLPYLPPQLIDAQKLIYLISDQAIDEPSKNTGSFYEDNKLRAYDGGVQLNRGGNYSSVADLESSAPSAGQVRFLVDYDGPTYMRLGSSPVYDVRVSTNAILGLNTSYNDIWPNDLAASVIGTENIKPGRQRILAGGLVRGDETIAEILQDHCRLKFSNVWADKDNKFHCEPFASDLIVLSEDTGVPSAVAYDFTENNISAITFEQILPAKRFTLDSGEVFGGTTASGASEEFKQDMKKQGSLLSHIIDKPYSLSKHRLAPEVTYTSKFYATYDELNNDLIIQSWSDFWEEHTTATITVKNGFNNEIDDALINLDLNDIARLTLPRFGLTEGVYCVVTSIRHDYSQNTMTFKLWW